jgi:putative ABC transport system substrate-binding protein
MGRLRAPAPPDAQRRLTQDELTDDRSMDGVSSPIWAPVGTFPIEIEADPSGILTRRRMLAASAALVLTSRAPSATAGSSPVRIGWLKIQDSRHTPGQLRAFREGLRALGMVDGRDYVLEQRYADDDESRLPSLAADLVRAGAAIIVATSQPSIDAAARVTHSVPVIGRMVDDPTASGLAQTLGRPGRNVTGIYAMTEELNPKRLSLLKEAVPPIQRVGVLLRRDFPNAKEVESDWRVVETAARALGLELLAMDAGSADDLRAALAHAAANRVGGVMTFRTPTVVTYLKLIAELCKKLRLPAVFDAREYVEAGGLLSYGPNIDAIYRQLATYVNKLLHGASPGELPVEEPTDFELAVNQHTAAAIGVTVPRALLLQADVVIR